MKRFFYFIFVLTACGKGSGPHAPVVPLIGGREMVIAASDYRTGMLLGVQLVKGLRLPEVPIHSDAIVRLQGGTRYVVNRLGQDNIQIVTRDGKTTGQFSVGRGLNPQDIVFLDDNTAYVSRFRSKSLLKVRLPGGAAVGNGVDFSALADGDGYPETTGMRKVGSQVLVVVQRLDTAHGFIPTDASYVSVVDPSLDTIVANIKLNFVNPVTALKKGPEGGIYVGCAGKMGFPSQTDGGIERLDLLTHLSTTVTTEAQLGGDIIDFEILSPDLGVAIVASTVTRLVPFSPKTGRAGKFWIESGGYYLQEVLWDGATLWVADRDPAGPSLTGWNALGKQVQNFALTLPPYHLELSP